MAGHNYSHDTIESIENKAKAIGFERIYAGALNLDSYQNERKELMLNDVQGFREIILKNIKEVFIDYNSNNLDGIIEALKPLGDLGDKFEELDSNINQQKKAINLLNKAGLVPFKIPKEAKNMLDKAREKAGSYDKKAQKDREDSNRRYRQAAERGFNSPDEERRHDEYTSAANRREEEERESERKRQRYLDDTYGGRNYEAGESTHDRRDGNEWRGDAWRYRERN